MRRSRVLESRLRERFVVTLKTGQSFEGLLYSHDDRHWVLRDASAIGAAEKNTNLPVDGEVVLLTAEIAYAQRP